MSEPRSDALVLFGATGDLAYQQIFPALFAMSRRGRLDLPVIGVARQPMTNDEFRARAKESLVDHDLFAEGLAQDETDFQTLAGQVDVRGEVEIVSSEDGDSLRAVGEHELRALGVRVRLDTGEAARFSDLSGTSLLDEDAEPEDGEPEDGER